MHKCHLWWQTHNQSWTLTLCLQDLHLYTMSRSRSWNAVLLLSTLALQCGHWRQVGLFCSRTVAIVTSCGQGIACSPCCLLNILILESHPALPLRLGASGLRLSSPFLNFSTCLAEMVRPSVIRWYSTCDLRTGSMSTMRSRAGCLPLTARPRNFSW